MNAKVETICDNEWVSLKVLKDPDNHINGYVFSHEKRCQGKIIAILPFRVMEEGKKQIVELLLRKEITPPWDRLREITSAITGGFEKDEQETAVHEMWEEAGYKVEKKKLIPLGFCFASKSSDTKYTLYAVDLTGKKKEGEAKGDGAKLEELADCYWTDDKIIPDVWDPLVSVMFMRLMFLFQKNAEEKAKKASEPAS